VCVHVHLSRSVLFRIWHVHLSGQWIDEEINRQMKCVCPCPSHLKRSKCAVLDIHMERDISLLSVFSLGMCLFTCCVLLLLACVSSLSLCHFSCFVSLLSISVSSLGVCLFSWHLSLLLVCVSSHGSVSSLGICLISWYVCLRNLCVLRI